MGVLLHAFPTLGQVVDTPPGGVFVRNQEYPKAWSRPIPGSILSDPALLASADEALDYLYNMQFTRADSLFNRIEERHPRHPIGPFLKSLTIWWQILSTLSVHDTSLDKAFLKEMDRVIDRSNDLLKRGENEFDAKFFRTAAYGFRGRLQSDRENWLRAAQDGKSALEFIFEIADADPQNADLLFGVGVYDYYAEVIPGRYPIVKPIMLFFPSGDRERGLKRLELAANHGRFVAAEAAYFLLQIYTAFESDHEKSKVYSRLLTQKYPENALFQVMKGRVHFRWGQWAEAEAVFKEVVRRFESGQEGYIAPLASQAHYYLGRHEMLQQNDAAAMNHFLTVLRLEAPYSYDSFFRSHATLRAGMVSDRMGKSEEARAYYRRVLKLENHSTSRDRARKYLNNPYGGGNE